MSCAGNWSAPGGSGTSWRKAVRPSRGPQDQRVSAVYSFIAEEKADPRSGWSVAVMCRTLGVSRQRLLRLGVPTAVRPPRSPTGCWRLRSKPSGRRRRAPTGRRGCTPGWAAKGSGWPASGSLGSCAPTAGWGSRAVAGCAPPSWTAAPGRPRTGSGGTSIRPPPMSPGRATSPTSPPAKAGCSCPPSSTCSPAGSSAGVLADHLRTPLVSAALEMAVATRGGYVDGVVFHSG